MKGGENMDELEAKRLVKERLRNIGLASQVLVEAFCTPVVSEPEALVCPDVYGRLTDDVLWDQAMEINDLVTKMLVRIHTL